MQNDKSPVKETVIFGNDSVVIRKFVSGIPGGRTLDCSGYNGDVIYAGHVIVRTSDGTYAPLGVKEATEDTPAAYDALPEGAQYAGVLYRSISKKDPAAAIMYDGVVNPELVPYPMADILEAFKIACPNIIFEQDEEA